MEKRYFYPDGTLRTIENYKDGKLHGEISLYWPNGKLKRKCHFCDGLRHGLDQMWSIHGDLVDQDDYEYGVRK
jgi:antitoxin component YwqK of YwqJK toxin-antitoxin module